MSNFMRHAKFAYYQLQKSFGKTVIIFFLQLYHNISCSKRTESCQKNIPFVPTDRQSTPRRGLFC